MSFSLAPAEEAELGMEVFLTGTAGVGGRLKRLPEDFIVDEVSLAPPSAEDGRFVIAKVTATNWEMNRLVRQLSKLLGISRNKIGFAGTKDKRAVTSQLMSFETDLESVLSLRVHQVEIADVYRSRKNLTIGDLIGNRFRVMVKECKVSDTELEQRASSIRAELEEQGGFPNFFGVQRFGSVRPITHLVGRSIVKGDFEEAVLWYVGNPHEEEDEVAREARKNLQESRDYQKALQDFPPKLTFERTVIGHLVRRPGDFVGAIRTLPGNLQMMFVHAYQSYMFNRILSERIRRGLPLDKAIIGDVVLPADRNGQPDHDKHVPVTAGNIDLVQRQMREGRAFISAVLYGQDSVLMEGEMGAIEEDVIEKEGLHLQDFSVPLIPECNSRGSRREILARFQGLDLRCSGDEMDVSFTLDKGCYATVLLREFMKTGRLDY